MLLFFLSYPTADTLVALEHDVCVWGCCEHFLVLWFTILFCVTSISMYVCMYVCEWRVLMAVCWGFPAGFFPYKVFLLFFFLGGCGPPAPK